jgi:ATP-binding cassette subfamily C protein
VSIHVKKGEFVAFVGPSGSGKSTIFRVLLGFEKPQSGAVYYDNQELSGLEAGSVRRQLGVVLQNGKLMPGDIYTNIVGSAPRTMDEAWEAARMAGLADDIKAMPMGMQTVISEGAGTISGGQRQRLMIARALVNRPAVLLFDEATSALDNQTQAIVANSVRQLDATRIVIAHRLSTIIQADRIFVIVAGKVVETGNYSELMALGGHFAELSKRQQV